MKMQNTWDDFLHVWEYFTTEQEAIDACLPNEQIVIACTNGSGGRPLVWRAPVRRSTHPVTLEDANEMSDTVRAFRIKRERLGVI